MTFAPGKRQPGGRNGPWHRDLRSDLERLRVFYHTSTLVSLLEDHELDAVGIADLASASESFGIDLVRFPIRDVSTPATPIALAPLVDRIRSDLFHDRTVVVHCMGGLGRTGLVTACVLVSLGDSPDRAVAGVRSARPRAIETHAQERFVYDFAVTVAT
jgi:protein-tyrosine phosphatase